jgi:hypothetical protein
VTKGNVSHQKIHDKVHYPVQYEVSYQSVFGGMFQVLPFESELLGIGGYCQQGCMPSPTINVKRKITFYCVDIQ